MFPDACIRENHPLPDPSTVHAGTDERRVRALSVEILEEAAIAENTLLSQKDVIFKIRDMNLSPACVVTGDTHTV